MTCPLCGVRKARRACPGVGGNICSVCCGTKRLVEIRCPATCGYLQSARAHPAAIEQRQRDRDVAIIVPTVRGLTDVQQRLFMFLLGVIRAQATDPLRPIIDADVADAAAALAATYETGARGVIYEHQTQSLPAERLRSELRAAIIELEREGGGRTLERDAPAALRAIERGARAMAATPGAGRVDYLDVVRRMFGSAPVAGAGWLEAPPAVAPAGLILPPD